MGGKAIAGLLSLAYMVVAVRALGATQYGVLILVHTYTISVGGIIEFPGWHAVVRYGAQAAEENNVDRLVRLMRLTAAVECAAGLVAVIVAAALAPLVGPHLGWSPKVVELAIPYSLAALATIRSTPTGYLQLAGRFDLLGIHNVIAPAVRLIGALISLALGLGLYGFLVAWLIAALAEWVSMWILGLWQARKRLNYVRLIGSPRGAVAENAGIRWFMFTANADMTFGDLSQRAMSLAIGWILGPAAAGIFAVAQRATVVISQPSGNLGQATYAELARLIAAGGRSRDIRQTFVKALLIAFAVAIPFVIAIAAFGDGIARLIGGHEFGAAGAVMIWLVAARAALLVAPPASAALVALGHPGKSFIANLICSFLLLPLLPLMMSWNGLIGVGIFALSQSLALAGLLGWLLWRQSSQLARKDMLPTGLPE